MKISVEAFLQSLKYMGVGMLGIFIVIAIIVLMVTLLNKVTSHFGKKNNEKDLENG